MNRLKTFAIASCIGLLVLAFAPGSRADEWDKKTTLTINEPLAISGTVLQPGRYVMKLDESPADRHVVHVFNEDGSTLIATVLAIPNYRLEPTGETQLAFWETPAGQPRALRAWFYPGDSFGQEFAYPQNAATQIAQTNNGDVKTIAPENGNNMPQGQVQEATPSSEAPAMAMNQGATSAVTSQPPAIDPPQSASDASASSQTNQSSAPGKTAMAPGNQTAAGSAKQTASKTLPKTASPYPLVGLAGLLLLGAALAARKIAKQVA